MSEENKTTETMSIWSEVENTDTAIAQPFNENGFSGTTVPAMHQIKAATKLWGPMGFKWGLSHQKYSIEKRSEFDSRYDVLVLSAELFYPYENTRVEISMEIEIDLWDYDEKLKTFSKNNDARKKVRTGLLTKALSQLGFNADIYLGKFDDHQQGKTIVADDKKLKELYSILYSLERRLRGRVDDKLAALKEYQGFKINEIQDSIAHLESEERKINAIKYVKKIFKKGNKVKSVIDNKMHSLKTLSGIHEVLLSVSHKFGVIDEVAQMFDDRVIELDLK